MKAPVKICFATLVLLAIFFSNAYGELSSKVDPALKKKIEKKLDDLIIQLLHDKVSFRRMTAAWDLSIYGHVAPAKALSALILAMGDNGMVRRAAAPAIREFGPLAAPDVPVLIAQEALEKIQSTP